MKTPQELKEKEEERRDQILKLRKKKIESILEELVSDAIKKSCLKSDGGLIEDKFGLSLDGQYWMNYKEEISDYLKKHGWNYKIVTQKYSHSRYGNYYVNLLKLWPIREIEEH